MYIYILLYIITVSRFAVHYNKLNNNSNQLKYIYDNYVKLNDDYQLLENKYNVLNDEYISTKLKLSQLKDEVKNLKQSNLLIKQKMTRFVELFEGSIISKKI